MTIADNLLHFECKIETVIKLTNSTIIICHNERTHIGFVLTSLVHNYVLEIIAINTQPRIIDAIICKLNVDLNRF